MSQVKLLKIDVDGIPVESSQADDITFSSFSVSGGAQVLSSTGLALGNTPISGVSNILFTSPSADFINQTAGSLIIDDIMAKERTNLMTTAGEILFPVVSNTSSQVDNFQVPAIAGAPTATPTNSGAGFMVFDTVDSALYVWNGTMWDNQNIVEEANRVANPYTAGEALSAVDAVYISAADTVSKADCTTSTKAELVGFARLSAASGASVEVISEGVLPGFSGLTAGSRYYLSPTAGVVSTTVPTGSGHTIVQAGYAKSATAMHLQIQNLGRRA